MSWVRCCIGAGFALALGAACGGRSRGPELDRGEGGGEASTASDPTRGNTAGGGSNAPDGDPDQTALGSMLPGSGGTLGFSRPSPNPPREFSAKPLGVPLFHREVATACDRIRPAGGTPLGVNEPFVACSRDEDCPRPLDCSICIAACIDLGEGLRCVSGFGECLLDSECMEGVNARCSPGGVCSADECFDDAACSFGGPCACEGADLDFGNRCLSGNCKTDVDCGPAGYCSPSIACVGASAPSGYYCHTPKDTCIDDADCVEEFQSGFCAYDVALGHWACRYESCLLP